MSLDILSPLLVAPPFALSEAVVAESTDGGGSFKVPPPRTLLSDEHWQWYKRRYKLEDPADVIGPTTVVEEESPLAEVVEPPEPPTVSFSVRATRTRVYSGGRATTFTPPSASFSGQATLQKKYAVKVSTNADRIARRRREEAAWLMGIVE